MKGSFVCVLIDTIWLYSPRK